MSISYQPPKFQYFDKKGNLRQYVPHFMETFYNVGTKGDLLFEQLFIH